MSNPSKTKKTKRQDYIGFLACLGPAILKGAIATVGLVGAPFSSARAASFSPDEPLLADSFANYSGTTEPAINGNSIFDGFSVVADELEEAKILSYLNNVLDIGSNSTESPEQDSASEFGAINIAQTSKCCDRFGFPASAAIAPIFPGSKGFGQTPNVFADEQTAPTGAPAGPTSTQGKLRRQTLLGAELGAELDPELGSELDTELGTELGAELDPELGSEGAGTRTPVLYSKDNIYQLAINIEPIDYSSFSASVSNADGGNTGTGLMGGNKTGESNTGSNNRVGSNIGDRNTGRGSGRKKVPEPSTLAFVFLAGLSLCCKKRRRR